MSHFVTKGKDNTSKTSIILKHRKQVHIVYIILKKIVLKKM